MNRSKKCSVNVWYDGNVEECEKVPMFVPLNGAMYEVRIVAGPLIVRGETTASRVSHLKRTIEVDSRVPAVDRWRVAALAVACASKNPVRIIPVVGTVE